MFCSQIYSQWLTWSLAYGKHSLRLVEWGKETVPLALSILWKGAYHVLTMSHSFPLFPIAREFTSLPLIFFPALWRYLGFWKSFVALVWVLEQPHHAAFRLFLKFWNRLWSNVELCPSTSLYKQPAPPVWSANYPGTTCGFWPPHPPHAHVITYFFWLGELQVHLLSAHSDFTSPLWPNSSELPSMTFSEVGWGLESLSLAWQ